jgi:hypothetical protein
VKQRVRSGRRSGAFALPLVAMVAFIALIGLSILLERQAAARQASVRQIERYQQHHFQNGVRQVTDVWSNIFKLNEEKKKGNSGVIGYDLTVESGFGSGSGLEVRFTDAQGTVRKVTTDASENVNGLMNFAAESLIAAGMDGQRYLRERGPAAVSLNSAPREVLAALVRAISQEGQAEAFAAAVETKRSEKRIAREDVRELLTAAGLPQGQLSMLEEAVTAEPQLWKVEAVIRSSTGEVLDRQGGLLMGSVKRTVAEGGSSGWVVLDWGPLREAAAAR